ncbi:MAG: Membrane-associated phospholipid phosphatase [Thermodesulfobacterium sp.]|uniref:Membrane-associated phospholipid phosphatase n=1 Tax=Candidatus Thermodesulfobacterium syntrophicum TaxID=3060442 RepID=A0AAE3P5P8_9BACT|nr:Membrane-associated phospholipid phosphatase [Candidatus Thermodesulfobacterium syntrophicum]
MKFSLEHLSKYRKWILFLLILFLFFVYLDKRIMLFIKDVRLAYPEEFAYLKIFNNLIERAYRVFIAISVILGFYNLFSKTQKEKGIKIILGMVIVGILSQAKYLLGRARPKITYETIFTGPSEEYVYASFPSGHTFFIFAMARIYSHIYPKYRIFFYTFAILVALERLLNFAHFPSDLIAGAFLGVCLGNIIISKTSKKLKD